jgi:hypothetical protein
MDRQHTWRSRGGEEFSDEQLMATLVRVLRNPTGLSRKHVAEFYQLLKDEILED